MIFRSNSLLNNKTTPVNVLFYIEPMILLDRPLMQEAFWSSAYRMLNSLRKSETAYSFHVILGDVIKERVTEAFNLDQVELHPVTNQEILKPFQYDSKNALLAWYHGTFSPQQLQYNADLIKILLGSWKPDVAITFSPAPFIIHLYPKCMVLHSEYGIVSRPPFPETFYFDPKGFFSHSQLLDGKIRFPHIDNDSKQLLKNFKDHYISLINTRNPFTKYIAEIRNRFEKIILVPLQVSNIYAFDGNCIFNSQSQFIQYILANLPQSIGAIFTPHPFIPLVSPDLIAYFSKHYDNFLYLPDCEFYQSASQYLLEAVDAVVSVSSMVGLQALIWDKKLVSIGSGQLSVAADLALPGNGAGLEKLNNILDWPYQDKDHILYWLLTHYYFPLNYIEDPDWFSNFINRTIMLKNKRKVTDIFQKPLDEPRKIINSYVEFARPDIPVRIKHKAEKSKGYTLVSGFYEDEASWSWMKNEGVIRIEADQAPVFFEALVSCGDLTWYPKNSLEVEIIQGETLLEKIIFQESHQKIPVSLSIESPDLNLVFRANASFVPNNLGISQDIRNLSIIMSEITVKQESQNRN